MALTSFKPSLGLWLVPAVIFLATPSQAVKYKKQPLERPVVPANRALIVAPAPPVSHSLQMFFSKSGALTLSVNGVGTELAFGTIEIEKPAGARLERAFLIAAAAGGYLHRIEDGRIRVDGHSVIWEQTQRNVVGSWNALADVTDFVRAKIDGAPPGRVLVDILEDDTALIDGCILAVVFENPAGPADDYVALYFGSQAARKDSLVVHLPSPVPSDATQSRFELGLGISYSHQSSDSSGQYTMVDVGGRRVTSSAGGPDDGSPVSGALLTVGGLNDSAENPDDASAIPANLASDDELYDLRRYLVPGDTVVVVKTQSPKSEENVFFAHCFFSYGPSATSAESGTTGDIVAAAMFNTADGVVLSATSPGTSVGSRCEVTASVRQGGAPVRGQNVELRVLAGPHGGAVSKAQTDSTGKATFLYRGNQKGRDLIVALALGDGGAAVAGSNVISHDWVEVKLDVSLDIAPGMCPNTIELGLEDVVTAILVGGENFAVDDVDVMSIYLGAGAPLKMQYRDVGSPAGEGECACSTDGGDGIQDLVLQFRVTDVFPDTAAIVDGEKRKLELVGSTKAGVSFAATDCVVFSKTRDAPTELPQEVLTPLATEQGP